MPVRVRRQDEPCLGASAREVAEVLAKLRDARLIQAEEVDVVLIGLSD